jgi:hemoglobin
MCNTLAGSGSGENNRCSCGGDAGRIGKVVETATELILPAVRFPSPRLLEQAGEAKLREAVTRHHILMAEGPLRSLFPDDPAEFVGLVDKVVAFVVEACGGAGAYSAQHGNTCMRTRHFPFTIDEAARETWLEALFQAMTDVAFPVEAREEYWTWLEAFSVRMINRRTMKAQPVRIPYAVARLRFGSAADYGLACGVRMHFCPRR